MRKILAVIGALCVYGAGAHAAEKSAIEAFVGLFERTVYLPAEKKRECTDALRTELTQLEIITVATLGPVDGRLHTMGCLDPYSRLNTDLDPPHKGDLPASGALVALVGDVAYVRIDSFTENMPHVIGRAYRRLPEDWRTSVRHVVLDLRNNPGGYVEILRVLLDEYFAPKPGIEFLHVDATRECGRMAVTKHHGVFAGLPLSILVDGKTASAAEWMIAVLRYEWYPDRSRIVGKRTYGKALVQGTRRTTSVIGAIEVRLTCGEWRIGEDRVNGIGITPDVDLDVKQCRGDVQCIVRRASAGR